MPGIATHILMSDLAADALTGPGDGEARDLINQNREMYHLGAVGPDLAFFAPDFGDGAVTLVRLVAELHDTVIGPIVELYETYVEPVVDVLKTIDEAADTVIDEVTCGLVGNVKGEVDELVERAMATAQLGLGSVIVRAVNVFDLMTPPIQKGETISSWFWFDTLHNRRTGRFLHEMWERADSDAQRAYVLGYSSHYAGDLVGHQFVNTVVGSPARARLQRHHFAENMIDTHIFDVLRDAEVSASAMHLLLPHGESVEAEPSLRVLVDRLNDIPPDMQEIFTMISDAMEAAFKDVPHPQRVASEYLTPEHLNTAFWLLLASMRASTATFIPRPDAPSLDALNEALDAVNDLLQTATNPPSPSVSLPDVCLAFWSDECDFSLSSLSEWAEAMADALRYLGEVVAWAGQLIKDLWDVMACTVTAPIKIGLEAGFYLLHSALHAALDRVREVMVQAAIIYPTREFVRSHPIAQSFLTITREQLAESSKGMYPHRAEASNEGFQRYPQTETELPPTWSSSFAMGTKAEEIVSAFPVSASHLTAFEGADEPAQNRTLAADLNGQPLGSVVPFTVMLQRQIIAGQASAIPDFNLDADRGWAHRNWVIDAGAENSVTPSPVPPIPVPYDWAE